MLPEIAGLRVLDLGCGMGWFCRWAQAQSAASVIGIDVSDNMLARAKAQSDLAIHYQQGDMDSLTLPHVAFDLGYSSLAFHYLKNLDALMAQIAGALVSGGRLVFSVEHPMVTAPLYPGWSRDKDGVRLWPVNHYLEDGARDVDWLGKSVRKQHRSMTTYMNMLVRHGLTLEHLEEWGPMDAQAEAQPSLLDERQRPNFLLVSASRR